MNNTVNKYEQSNVLHGRFRKNAMQRLIGRIKEWNNRRQAIKQLQMMPDSFLRDIGIERYQISDVVNQKGAFKRLHVSQAKKPVTATTRKEAA